MHVVSGRWRLGFSLAMLTALFWGTLPIPLKVALHGLDALTIVWCRFTAAAIVLGAYLAWRGKIPSRPFAGTRKWLLAAGLIGIVCNYVLFILALDLTSPTVTQIVIQLANVFLMIGGVLIFKERFSRLQRLGLALLVLGLMVFFNRRLPLVLHPAAGMGLGVLMLVAASVVWAGYGLAQKRLLAVMDSQQILWLLYVGASLVLLPWAHLHALATLDSKTAWALTYACANTLLGYGAFAEAMAHWEVSRVGATVSMGPVFTLLTTYAVARFAPAWMSSETLNSLTVVGSIIVVSGSALCALGSATAAPDPVQSRPFVPDEAA